MFAPVWVELKVKTKISISLIADAYVVVKGKRDNLIAPSSAVSLEQILALAYFSFKHPSVPCKKHWKIFSTRVEFCLDFWRLWSSKFIVKR